MWVSDQRFGLPVKYLLRPQSDVEAACPCCTSGSPISDYNWGWKGGAKQGPCQQTLQIWGQFRPLIAHMFVCRVCSCVCFCEGARDSKSLLLPHWSHHHHQKLNPQLPPCLSVSSSCFSSTFPSFNLPCLPPSLFPSPLPLPLLLFYSLALLLCLLFRSPPLFANHFFPCQQVNCFVLPFPAFITLCKLSDMSSNGARQSTHRANAKIMRFGIINEDKLAVAVLLSMRARLHYSLNLPEKMT